MTVHHAPARPTMARVLLVLAAAAGLVLAGFAWRASSGADEAVAFNFTWRLNACTASVRPSTSQRGLLDDSPGAGAGNDAGFVYVTADDSFNESCDWYVNVNLANTNHRTLRARAAVNDGGRLWVRAFSGEACTGTELAWMAYGSGFDAPADGSFATVDKTMTLGTVGSVCVMLDDRANSHTQRISALIDLIQLRSTTQTLWQETFTKAG